MEEEAYALREPAGYTDEVYREISRGMKAHMRKDGRITQGGAGCVCAVDEGEEGKAAVEHWDDISGKPLEKEGMKKARAEEMEEFKTHGVYEK
eukprot:6411907-Lingulodinium_polyedra.AAC.1